MRYYLDGYNLLFYLFNSDENLQKQRQILIDFLQKKNDFLKFSLVLVFDSVYKEIEHANVLKSGNITLIYSPRGLTADEYIIEKVSISKTPAQITVVSSDKHLTFQCAHLGAHTMSSDSFLEWIDQKSEKKKTLLKNLDDVFTDSDKNIQRLLRIFEKRLREEGEK